MPSIAAKWPVSVRPASHTEDKTRFASSEYNRSELYLYPRLNIYKLVYDPADQSSGEELAGTFRFTPNPVVIANSTVVNVGSGPRAGDVTLDLGATAFHARLRITDASCQLVHDVELSGVEVPYTWNTSGMTAVTFIVESWSAGNAAPVRGKLSVIRP